MAGKPKNPDVTKLPILHAVYWPSTQSFFQINDFFSHNLAATVTAQRPAILHGEVEAYQVKEGRTKRRYWIVKYIPVAILDTEYKQLRIPAQAEGA